jgi:hypothetical protein
MSTKQAEQSARRIDFSRSTRIVGQKEQVKRKEIVITSWLYIDLSQWEWGYSDRQEIA